ncbi:MAG TPA: ABC transporter substrate-binding protein [Terriglobales bacterium]|nr:ABC transporter substrate-binding protein [Terriglobales bacterium]
MTAPLAYRAWTGALVLVIVLAGCATGTTVTPQAIGRSRTLTVAGFNFAESSILANIYGKALRQHGYATPYELNLGNREVVEPALEKGSVDLYPGYAATELEFINGGKGEATSDVNSTLTRLNGYLSTRGLRALQPAPAVDTNGFAVTRATADRYHLRRISDLLPVAGALTLGGPPECPSRPFCQAGLQKTYGLNFKAFKPLDAGGALSKVALENGSVDIALIFTSDGVIAAKDFVVLEDDKHLQNADNVVPVIRSSVAGDDVVSLLNDISSKLTTQDLIELNQSSQLDHEDPDVLAQRWLSSHGY